VLFIFYIVACIGNAIVTIVAFFLYVKARLAYLEKKEKKYRSIHFITLSLFVLFGVLILIHLSNRLNGVIQR
jgi:cytochrome bd-type quinol oxidase subunit 2